MEITLEMVDQVRERTYASYERAKSALEESGGNVLEAIIAIEREENSQETLVDRVNEALRQGNTIKLRISKGGEELLSIPLTTGAILGAVGLVAAPGTVMTAVVTGVVAKFGFDCKYELIRDEGGTVV